MCFRSFVRIVHAPNWKLTLAYIEFLWRLALSCLAVGCAGTSSPRCSRSFEVSSSLSCIRRQLFHCACCATVSSKPPVLLLSACHARSHLQALPCGLRYCTLLEPAAAVCAGVGVGTARYSAGVHDAARCDDGTINTVPVAVPGLSKLQLLLRVYDAVGGLPGCSHAADYTCSDSERQRGSWETTEVLLAEHCQCEEGAVTISDYLLCLVNSPLESNKLFCPAVHLG